MDKPVEEKHLKRAAADDAGADECNPCHNLEKRIVRLHQNGADLSGRMSLPMEDKVALCKEGANLKGKVLEALVMEKVKCCRMLSSTLTFTVSEKFMDAADVRTHYKDKPEQLAEFWKNTEPFVCPKTKVEMYPVPVYTRCNAEEDKAQETRERESTDKRKLQTVARPKPKAKPAENASEGDGDTHEVPLGAGKIVALSKIKEKLQAKKVEFTAVMLEADAPDMKADMPRATIKKATELMQSIDIKLALLAKAETDKKAPKEALKTLVAEQSDTMKSIDFIVKQLNNLISDITESKN